MKKTLIISGLLLALNSALAINNQESNTVAEYVHLYANKPLRTVLQEISGENSLQLKLSTSLSAKVLNAKVTGKYIVNDNKQLLDELGKQYGFTWFNHNGSLQINDLNQVEAPISVSQENMSAVAKILNGDGLLNNNFNYTEIPDQDRIIIRGSKEYVSTVKTDIDQLGLGPGAQQFAIYRLHYANATDMSFSYNNQQITVPGVATLLANLLGAHGSHGTLSSQVNQLGNNGATYSTTESVPVNSTINDYSLKGGGEIEADPRLNTIIIRDKLDKLQLYANLIKELDVQAPLIQVDVVEIRVNDTKLNQEGANWLGGVSHGVGVGGSLTAPNTTGANGMTTSGLGGSNSSAMSNYLSQLTPGNFIVSDFKSFVLSIQALEQKNLLTTVNHPSLVTIDNLPAIMSNVQTLYITMPTSNVSVYNTTSSNLSGVAQAQVTTALSITPHVIKSSDGSLDVKLLISLQSGDIENPMTAPVTNQNTITSQAVIHAGQSLLMAGYTNHSMQKVVNKVPFLGSIPLLGWFFRSSSMQDTSETNLYLISPKIIMPQDFLLVNNKINLNGNNIQIPNNHLTTKSISNLNKTNTMNVESSSSESALGLNESTLAKPSIKS